MEVDVVVVAVVVVVVDVVVAVVMVVLACNGLLENISTKLWKSGLGGLGVEEDDDGLEVLSVSFFLLLNIDVSKSLSGDRNKD